MDVNLTKHNDLYLTCSIIHYGASTITTLYHQLNLHKFDKPSMLFAPWELDASKHVTVVSPNVFGHPMSHKTWNDNLWIVLWRKGSCHKSRNKPSFDRELAPDSMNLAITGKIQDMVEVGEISLCCFSYRWSNPNIAGYFWSISHYPHLNIEGWLFKCITQSFLFLLEINVSKFA
jgi:hypothetical protein